MHGFAQLGAVQAKVGKRKPYSQDNHLELERHFNTHLKQTKTPDSIRLLLRSDIASFHLQKPL